MTAWPHPVDRGCTMWTTDDYRLRVPADPAWISHEGETIFRLAWRRDFTAPGFCVLDLEGGVDSHALRSLMVALKGRLSDITLRETGRKLVYASMARFDQQETTKFHLDGAPDESMLMLGYEPSRVRSRLFLADYSRAAFDAGITPRLFLQDFNPMHRRGEDLQGRYTTELPQPDDGHSRILLINNSSLPYTTSERMNSLGVLHKAEIPNPDASERRIVNSTMLFAGELDEVGPEQQQEFVSTEKISQKVY
jgi:hypothetical protein